MGCLKHKLKDTSIMNDKFLEQAKVAIDIFEAKYPDARGVFMFDNAPCHRKVSDDALNAEKMNVKPGGSSPSCMILSGMVRYRK